MNVGLLLNCNKLKALKTNEEEIIKAVGFSKLLEPSKDGKSIRRIGNKELPELKLLNQKRNIEKPLEKEKSFGNNKDDKNSFTFEDVFLKITSDQEVKSRWKAIQMEYQRLNPLLNIVYMRFNKNEGHIGIIQNSGKVVEIFKNKFEFEGVNYELKKCEGDDLINFWKEHGGHYENCVKRTKRELMKKMKEKIREDRTKNILKKEVSLGKLK